jgi:hypothetical protein
MKQLLLVFVSVGALLLAGCGNGGQVNLGGGLGGNTGSNFSNASFSGPFAFLLEGDNSGGFYRAGGVMTADGNGQINSGTFDFAPIGSGAAASSFTFTGTYSIARDGTGTATLNFSDGSTLLFQLAIAGARVYMIEADSQGNAGGTAEAQDSASLSTLPSGTFAFRLHGQRSGGSSGAVGVFTAAGGGLTGNEDLNLAGTLTASLGISGTVNAPAGNGRGTLSITDANGFSATFAYYVVNAGSLRMMSVDVNQISGQAEAQATGPFSNASLAGGYAFGSQGDTSTFGAAQSAGRFTADGNGGIRGGVSDSVLDGNAAAGVNFTGSYTVDASGRAIVNLATTNGAVQEIFRLVSPRRVFLLVNNGGRVEDGTMDRQSLPSFSNGSMTGQFGFLMHGFDANDNVDRDGVMQADGAGALSVLEVVNRTGVVNQPGTLSGTYVVSSGGRVTASVNNFSSNLVIYLSSSTQGYVLQGDSATEISGTITHQ